VTIFVSAEEGDSDDDQVLTTPRSPPPTPLSVRSVSEVSVEINRNVGRTAELLEGLKALEGRKFGGKRGRV